MARRQLAVRLGVVCAEQVISDGEFGPAAGVAVEEPDAAEEARSCVRCGLCLSVCPEYRESLKETDSPRARVALVQALEEGLIEGPSDLVPIAWSFENR